MATPKGMQAIRLPVNESDAVHVYSNEHHVWLQLRRNFPTESDIGRPSFKTAVCLQTGTAERLGNELLKIAKRNKVKQRQQQATCGLVQGEITRHAIRGLARDETNTRCLSLGVF